MSRPTHLNTAGAGLLEPAARAAMAEYLRLEAEIGPYETEERYTRVLTEDVYRGLGDLLGCGPDEIALFGSATDAWCRVVRGLRLRPGGRIWTTPYEYAANLMVLRTLCDETGSELVVIPTLPDGDLDLDWMRAELDETVSLVSLVHMPSGAGVVLPVAEVGRILAGSAAVYAVDACQTVGQLPLDVGAIGCDLLTGAGRKFLCGPRGTGFAFVARRIWDRVAPSFVDVHAFDPAPDGTGKLAVDSAVRFETAERSVAAVVGLAEAVEASRTRERSGSLGAEPEVFGALDATLAAAPGVRPITPGRDRAGIVSFVHDRLSAAQVRAALTAEGCNVWEAHGAHTPLFFSPLRIDHFIRVSVHWYNTPAEIDGLGRALSRLADH